VLPGCDLAGAGVLIERMRRRLRDPVETGSAKLSVTCSFGLAQFGVDDNVATVIERADQALYTAKAAGRDRVHVARPLFAPVASSSAPIALAAL
jgi:PleD family two-component response regulator